MIQRDKIREAVAKFLATTDDNEKPLAELVAMIAPDIEKLAENSARGNDGVVNESLVMELFDIAVVKIGEEYKQRVIEQRQAIQFRKAYFKKVARNAMRTYFGDEKEWEHSGLSRRDRSYSKVLAFDETLPIGDELEDREAEPGGFGWTVFRAREDSSPKKRNNIDYPRLLLYFLLTYWPSSSVSLERNFEQAELALQKVPGEVDRRMMRERFLGYAPSGIAKQLGKQPSNVSGRLNYWLGQLGWDDRYLRLFQMGMLAHNLVKIGQELVEYFEEFEEPQAMNLLYRRVTTDHRTAAHLGRLSKDDVVLLVRVLGKLDPEEGGLIEELDEDTDWEHHDWLPQAY